MFVLCTNAFVFSEEIEVGNIHIEARRASFFLGGCLWKGGQVGGGGGLEWREPVREEHVAV